MKYPGPNHYEKAFCRWLIDNRVSYIAVDEQKRAIMGKSKIKSFDFLIYPPAQQTIVAEVKGRAFDGKSLAKLTRMQCWVTTDDVEGLSRWQRVFGHSHLAIFVFAYRMKNIDIDLDGRETYDFDGHRYLFFAVKLQDYCRFMKMRSPKWKTVNLSAENFRKCAVQMQNLIL